MSDTERQDFATLLDDVHLGSGERLVLEGTSDTSSLYFVIDGRARVVRGGLVVRELHSGDVFGEFGMLAGHVRQATVEAASPLHLARLTRDAYAELEALRPTLALKFLRGIVSALSEDMRSVTESVGSLLRERSTPRKAVLHVEVAGAVQAVVTGTRVGDLLPSEVNGDRVVAALLERRPVSLDEHVFTDSRVEAVTLASWEGRDVYRRSVSLLALEAARRISPTPRVRIAQSMGSAQRIELESGEDPVALAPQLQTAMDALVAERVAIEEEVWSVEEATAFLTSVGEEAAARLLTVWRTPTARLVRCGETYVLSAGPLLPSAASLGGFRVVPGPGGLLLDFGEALEKHFVVRADRTVDPVALEAVAPRYSTPMAKDHRRWLSAMGATSIGAYNELCIQKRDREILRAAEGFHEKALGRLADRIAEASPRLRVIAVAGPSSSGKTSLIRRLTVQLQINGINPVGLSLDDYYKARALVPLDEKGDKDYEAFDSINSALARGHIEALVTGKRQKLARYDFLEGECDATGGAELQLGAHDVLLVEGIHGMNPMLLDGILPRESIFRVFIHPTTTLPFDRLSVLSPNDVRLLRRIVRDRHHRGSNAADTLRRWPSVRRGERVHIYPFLEFADFVFDSALVYEISILKTYAEQYLLEVPRTDPTYPAAYRLRHILDRFVALHPDQVPHTSILREFIGGSGFDY
jgi:uridine kinase